MRVAMVAARCLPFMGGIETHVEEVGRRLATRGVELTVLTTDVTRRLPAVEQRDGFVLQRFDAFPHRRDYYVSPALVRALRRGNFDLVHVQGIHTCVCPLALLTAQRRGLPTALTFHTGGSSRRLRNMMRNLQWAAERPLLRRTDRLIAVCEHEISLFARSLRLPESRFTLIRNGSGPLPGDEAGAAFSGDPLVLSIGRLERYKGHQRAVRAMPALLDLAPFAHLVVVGSGPFEADLRKLVDESGLAPVVSFTSFGPAERGGLGALLRASDVVVQLSEYEAHPVSVMEALALGVDVVVADTSGLSELARAGLVTAIELDAAPDVLAKTIHLAASDRRWSGSPPELPSWDDCAEQLARTYEEMTTCGS